MRGCRARLEIRVATLCFPVKPLRFTSINSVVWLVLAPRTGCTRGCHLAAVARCSVRKGYRAAETLPISRLELGKYRRHASVGKFSAPFILKDNMNVLSLVGRVRARLRET